MRQLYDIELRYPAGGMTDSYRVRLKASSLEAAFRKALKIESYAAAWQCRHLAD